MSLEDGFYIDTLGRNIIEKDPDSTIVFDVDWTEWLDARSDTIQGVEWIMAQNSSVSVTIVQSVHDGKINTVTASGGDSTFIVERGICRITTTAGRIEDRSIYFRIVEK
jgi:hypothetical protein